MGYDLYYLANAICNHLADDSTQSYRYCIEGTGVMVWKKNFFRVTKNII